MLHEVATWALRGYYFLLMATFIAWVIEAWWLTRRGR